MSVPWFIFHKFKTRSWQLTGQELQALIITQHSNSPGLKGRHQIALDFRPALKVIKEMPKFKTRSWQLTGPGIASADHHSTFELTRPEGPSSLAQDFRPALKVMRIHKP